MSIHPSGISHQLLPPLGPGQQQASIFGSEGYEWQEETLRAHRALGPPSTGVSHSGSRVPGAKSLSLLPSEGLRQGLCKCRATAHMACCEPTLGTGAQAGLASHCHISGSCVSCFGRAAWH